MHWYLRPEPLDVDAILPPPPPGPDDDADWPPPAGGDCEELLDALERGAATTTLAPYSWPACECDKIPPPPPSIRPSPRLPPILETNRDEVLIVR